MYRARSYGSGIQRWATATIPHGREVEAASRQSVWDVTTRIQRTHSISNPNGQTVMSVRSSVFESLTASVAVTRSNVIGRYTAETDTYSICSMVHHSDTAVAILTL